MIKKYENLFFDMDGTLIASLRGISSSLKKTFAHFDLVVPEEELVTFIGPPLEQSFRNHFPDHENVTEILDQFRKEYFAGDIYDVDLYDGIAETLAKLKEDGYRIYTATSKKEDIAIKVAEKFDILKYFDKIYGAESYTRRTKEEVLSYALSDSGAKPENSLLIGDTIYDLEGAKICGVPCMYVSYGYGTKESVSAYKYVFEANTPLNILDFLI